MTNNYFTAAQEKLPNYTTQQSCHNLQYTNCTKQHIFDHTSCVMQLLKLHYALFTCTHIPAAINFLTLHHGGLPVKPKPLK